MPGGTISLGLQVAEVETAREELESRGVVLEGETIDADGLKIAFTSDPDGIPIYVLETSVFR